MRNISLSLIQILLDYFQIKKDRFMSIASEESACWSVSQYILV